MTPAAPSPQPCASPRSTTPPAPTLPRGELRTEAVSEIAALATRRGYCTDTATRMRAVYALARAVRL